MEEPSYPGNRWSKFSRAQKVQFFPRNTEPSILIDPFCLQSFLKTQ